MLKEAMVPATELIDVIIEEIVPQGRNYPATCLSHMTCLSRLRIVPRHVFQAYAG
jgi:hypothetical protein